MTELDWRLDAACLGHPNPEVFFPERGDHAALREAKAVCEDCLVREDCLDFALEHRERLGVWGGMAGKELQRAAKARGQTGQRRWQSGRSSAVSERARSASA